MTASSESGIQVAPDTDDSMMHRAMVMHLQAEKLREAKNWEKAVVHYREAISLNSDFPWSHNGLGECLLRLGKPEEAEQCLRRFADLNPNFVWAYRNLGESLEQQGNWQEAMRAYGRALDLVPDSLSISQKLSYVKWQHSRFSNQDSPNKTDQSGEAYTNHNGAKHRSNSSDLPFSVDAYVKEISVGISLVTCCMNRNENLIKALRTWIDCPEIHQIVIVDWSSNTSVEEEINAASISDSRILIVRVEGQSRWILSYAFNLGFRVAGYDKILKTDADITINSSFFEENKLGENTFLAGDWRTAQKGQEHINGFFFIQRADLFGVQGFNEYITTYGWDDDDLYSRLDKNGISRVGINANGIYHIPHSDSLRMGGEITFDNALDEISSKPDIKSICNKYIASLMPKWDHYRFFVPFEVTAQKQNCIQVKQSAPSYHQVPSHVRNDADYYGLCTALSWTTELLVYSIPKQVLYSLLLNRSSSSNISRMDIRLAAFTDKPVTWHPHVIVVYFEPDVTSSEGAIFVQQLVKLAEIYQFTIFVEERIYSALSINEASGLQPVLQIPSGFYTHDLTECSPDVLCSLLETFQDEAAFWVKLELSDIRDVTSALSSSFSDMSQPPRFYIHVQHGLGNRLRALASAIIIARKSGRELILIWEPDNHCECEFGDLFEYQGKVLTSTSGINLDDMDCYSYMEIEPDSCKDEYISLQGNRDVYIRSAYVINNEFSSWEDENRILQELEPVTEVKALMSEVEASGRVGVHIRMEGSKGTDHNSYDASYNWSQDSHEQLNHWRGKSHYSNFMKRMDYMIDENTDTKFFIAADTKEAYEEFISKYGDRVSYLKRNVFDRSKEQLWYALADALLLSKCSYLLGSTWSSFTELSQRFSRTIKKFEMSGTDF